MNTDNIDNLTVLLKDGTHGTHKDVENGIPLLSAKDIQNGKILIPNDCRRISEADFNRIHSTYNIKANDLLLTIVGTIGRCALVRDIENKVTFQRSVGILRFDDKLDPKYAYYFVSSNAFQKQLLRIINASAQGGVYLGELAKVRINYPEKPIQQKISKILSNIDKVIEKTEAAIEKYKAIKQGMMLDLLTKGIDGSGNIRSEATHKFKDSPLGRFPKDWEYLPLSELCDVVVDCKNRTCPFIETGYPVIRTTNIKDGQLIWDDMKYTDHESYIEWTKRELPIPGDVIITREAPLGEILVIPEDITPCLGQRTMHFRTNRSKLSPYFLQYMVMSNSMQTYMNNIASGSTVKHLRVDELKELHIPTPSIPEQIRIEKALRQIDKAIRDEERTQNKLSKIKDGLMRDLLDGRVSVN
jgi:type I restriction enzyme S subunit